jgi:pimeloyl-ACP methyl ester carboxylesterase
MNALSPLYCNLTPFTHINPKPPVLWIRGNSDVMVADNIKISPAYYGKRGILPNWPGEAVFPDQPQLQQIRLLLENYAGSGGKYREVVLEDCGHLVHLEEEACFLRELVSFIASAHDLAFPSSKL